MNSRQKKGIDERIKELTNSKQMLTHELSLVETELQELHYKLRQNEVEVKGYG
jgi:hypothetical protein